jgi:heat shock protein HtpX
MSTTNYLKTALLLGSLTGLLLLVGHLVGGESGVILAFVVAMAMNFGAYWFSDRIVLRMHNAKPVTEAEAPRLHSIVDRLVARAGMPKPKLYLLPQQAPNAFATGRNPAHGAVAVTQGLLQLMDEEEVEGVVAHELAHIQNRDILISTIAATVAGAISMLAFFARYAAIFGGGRDERNGGNALGLLVAALVAPLAAMIIQLAVSRSREYAADATGARYAGHPQGLARALEKLGAYSKRIPMETSPAMNHMYIVMPLGGGGLARLFSTHPPIEERVRRLLGRPR